MTNTNGKYPFDWKGRIPPAELSLDDYVMEYPDGSEVAPYAGHVVYLLPYLRHLRQAAEQVGDARRNWQAAFGTEDSPVDEIDLEAVDEFGLGMARALCQRALAWPGLSDPITGEEYPDPDIRGKTPEEAEQVARRVYEALDDSFLIWLYGRLTNRTDPADRGNASGGSAATSSGSKKPKRPRKSN